MKERSEVDTKTPRTCWFKPPRKWQVTAPISGAGKWIQGEWTRGIFHSFMQDYEEFESGPGLYPAAVVENFSTGQVVVTHASDVNFGDHKPD
jgi:hypothetical protein